MTRPQISPAIYRALARISLSLALVIAMGVAMFWYTVPSTALSVAITPPTNLTLGGVHTFTVEVTVTDPDIVPINTVDMYIYNASNRASYEAKIAAVPKVTTSRQAFTVTPSGSGSVWVTAAAGAGWRTVSGTGYAMWEGSGYSIWGTTSGYAYGYGGGSTSITYTVEWTSPTSWPAGSYKIDTSLVTTGRTFTKTSSAFTLSAATVAPATSGSGSETPTIKVDTIGDITDAIDEEGIFTNPVEASSEDGNVVLDISAGTFGLTAQDEPLSEINVLEMTYPPAPPSDSNIIGLTYDLGPDGATFSPPIILTFTYDPDDLPAGVGEGQLTIAMWDNGKWVELDSWVDQRTNTIKVRVHHFTIFTILTKTVPTSAPAAPSASAPTPAPTSPPAPEPPVVPPVAPSGANWWRIGGILAAVIGASIIIGAAIRRKKRSVREPGYELTKKRKLIKICIIAGLAILVVAAILVAAAAVAVALD